MASIINATTTAGVSVQGDNSGSLQLATNNGTTAVTIDTSQNVGIGTSSPATKTEIQGSAETLRLSRSTSGSVYLGLAQAGTRKAYLESNNADVNLFAEAASSNLIFGTVSTERGRFDASGNFQFNSGYGSSAIAFGCRAWVNFNGTGTVAIRGSGNVSSITDNGTGDYTVNFSTAMPDTNYALVGFGRRENDTNQEANVISANFTASKTTSAMRIKNCLASPAVIIDSPEVNVIVLR